MAEDRQRTLYGRRRGKPLRPGRQRSLTKHWPELALPLDKIARSGPKCGDLFGFEPRELWLEIGFGAGEHLAQQARNFPDIAMIGCEPFENGVARLVGYVEELGLKNIRVLSDDAALVLERLPEAVLDRVILLFPDPWPKRRHHKRRFVRPGNIALVARALRPGGLWRMATDDASYCRWMLRHMTSHPDFAWCARGPGDWRQRPCDWPQTRYEQKALEAGRRPAFLTFLRRNDSLGSNA